MSNNQLPNQITHLSKRASHPDFRVNNKDKKINEKIIKCKVKNAKIVKSKKNISKISKDEKSDDSNNDHPNFLNAIDIPESTFEGKIKEEELITISEPAEEYLSDEIDKNNITDVEK